MPPRPLRYADAGVHIDTAAALIDRIRPAVKATARPGADAELGGFGGVFDRAATAYQDPLLVAATDGVGTKLRLAIEHNQLSGLGQDLVAMCVNDLVVQELSRFSFSTISHRLLARKPQRRSFWVLPMPAGQSARRLSAVKRQRCQAFTLKATST